MAKKKPRSKRPSKTDAKLKQEIANYNRRIARAKAKTPGMERFYPEKLSYNQVKGMSAKQKQKLIRRLGKFKGEGLELTIEDDKVMTKAQLDIQRRMIREENRRRAEMRDVIEAGREGVGRFPVREDFELQPLTLKDVDGWDILRERITDYAIDDRTERWRSNYLNQLELNRQQALINFMLTDEIEDAFDNIRHIVEGLTAEQFYLAMRTNVDVFGFQITSDYYKFAQGIMEIEARWEMISEF
jgi:hypothetical protein